MSERNPNTVGVVFGALMILFGALALLAQVFRDALDWSMIWPFAVVAAGAAFFVVMFAGGRSSSAFAIPGSILGTIGLMLLYQNLTGHWESWSYGWAVIVMSVGIGITIMGLRGRNSSVRRAGLRVLRVGLILFVVFGAMFELIFFADTPSVVRQYFFPAMLILVGVYLVLTRRRELPSISSPTEPKDEVIPAQEDAT